MGTPVGGPAPPDPTHAPQPRVELAWAMKAHQHAEVYFNLISSVDPKFLNLTKVDDQIYSEFRKTFTDLKIDVLDPEELKSEPAKEKWRPFCLRFEGVVEDFNYGTLLRLDCRQPYTEENTIFATRIQFFAIEIARNREGWNSVVYSSTREPVAGEAAGQSQLCSSSESFLLSPLATRIQFFAIEIARNREGWNSVVYSSTREPVAVEAASG
ncbi:PREDICTED: protein PBDC1 [Buceros rhinoceros silvestris]|nr:PREDICTED: protein PBDC1 [Buceros rhinoceros silvestris]